jgi:hypothetical protein
MIIVDFDAKAKTAEGNRYWKKLSDLGTQGEDIWFVATAFKHFAQLIPDLKSLTPADALLKAIQGIAREHE